MFSTWGFTVIAALTLSALVQGSAADCTVVPKNPPPPGVICNKRGIVKSLDELVRAFTATSFDDCRASCSNLGGCKAFGFLESTEGGSCQLLASRLRNQDFSKSRKKPVPKYLYNNLRCFSTCPPPAPTTTITSHATSEPTDTSTAVPSLVPKAVVYSEGATVENITASSSKDVVSGMVDAEDNAFYLVETLISNSSLVSLESFLPFIEELDCSTSTIQITFASKEAFDIANDSWPAEFFLVTLTRDLCAADDDGRTFYKVKDPSFNPGSNSVSVPIELSTKQEAAPGWTIVFGTNPPSDVQQNKERLVLSSSGIGPRAAHPHAQKIANAIRNQLSSRNRKREDATSSVVSLTPSSFHFTGSGVSQNFGGGGFALSCNPAGSCGISGNMYLYGYVNCEAFGFCNPRLTSLDIHLYNPKFGGTYQASANFDRYFNYTDSNRKLATYQFYSLFIKDRVEFTFGASLRRSMKVVLDGPISSTDFGYTGTFKDLYIHSCCTNADDTIEYGKTVWAPTYNSFEGASFPGFAPSRLDLTHTLSTEPWMEVRGQGDNAGTIPYVYRGERMNYPQMSYSAYRCADRQGPPAFYQILQTQFTIDEVETYPAPDTVFGAKDQTYQKYAANATRLFSYDCPA